MNANRGICSPYRPRPCNGPPRSSPHRIVLLVRSDGSRVGEPRTTPRDMPGYRGDGPSKTLMLTIDRQSEPCTHRALMLHRMALEQLEREQAAEMERGR